MRASLEVPSGLYSMSPWPSSASAPFTSRITRESVCDDTANAIRDGTLALIMPVITSTRGPWVASTRWMPTARLFCASRMIVSSTSAGETIIRSASSSITTRMYGIGSSPRAVRMWFISTRLRAFAAPISSYRLSISRATFWSTSDAFFMLVTTGVRRCGILS